MLYNIIRFKFKMFKTITILCDHRFWETEIRPNSAAIIAVAFVCARYL